jgi:hypothetical protein
MWLLYARNIANVKRPLPTDVFSPSIGRIRWNWIDVVV